MVEMDISKTYLLYTLVLASPALSTVPPCTRNLYLSPYSYPCMRSRNISIDTLRRIHEFARCNWTHVARQMDMWCFWGVLNAAILCWICLVWFPLVHLVSPMLVVTMFWACLIFLILQDIYLYIRICFAYPNQLAWSLHCQGLFREFRESSGTFRELD